MIEIRINDDEIFDEFGNGLRHIGYDEFVLKKFGLQPHSVDIRKATLIAVYFDTEKESLNFVLRYGHLITSIREVEFNWSEERLNLKHALDSDSLL